MRVRAQEQENSKMFRFGSIKLQCLTPMKGGKWCMVQQYPKDQDSTVGSEQARRSILI